MPKKEEDPGIFTILVKFGEALADLGASVSNMSLSLRKSIKAKIKQNNVYVGS